MQIDRLEPRTLFASAPNSALDAGFSFSQAAVDAAAGVHVDLTQDTPTQAAGGKTLLVGRVQYAFGKFDILLVRILPDGSLDKTFSGDGLVDSGFDLPGGRTDVTTDRDGYIYLATADRIVRLRDNGTRDRSFGGGRPVNYTGGEATSGNIALAANNDGGVDIVRSVDRDLGRAVPAFFGEPDRVTDAVVQLLHVDDSGSVRTIFERGTRGDIDDQLYVSARGINVTLLADGGRIVIAARQLERDFGGPTLSPAGGDVLIYFVGGDEQIAGLKTFNTSVNGFVSDVSNVQVLANGRVIRFTYDGGRRELTLVDGKRVSRKTYTYGPGLAGLGTGQNLLVNRQPLPFYYSSPERDGLSFRLVNRDGSVDENFGQRGGLELDPGVTNANITVADARPGQILVGIEEGGFSGGLQLLRLWTGRGPTATLLDSHARRDRPIFSVAYRAPAGIAPGTVGSQDIFLRSATGTYTRSALLDITTHGDTLIARYRGTPLPPGTFGIELQPRQIGTGDNAVNEVGQTLGQVTIG